MATALDEGDVPEQEVGPSSLKELCNALYASCASQAINTEFSQQDLLDLHVIPNQDLVQLQSCLQRLAQDGLLKMMTRDGTLCWKVVKKEDAAKYNALSIEEALVYSYVESSGREGIWTRTIRNRTNLHQAVFNRCLKTLETKHLIKSIQNAKFPKRKVYILAHLQPSEDITGGPFYTDGVLDEEFVHQLGLWAERYVLHRSWYHPPTKSADKKRKRPKMPPNEAESLKAQEYRESLQEKMRIMQPMPAGYLGYPTVAEITKAVNESGLSGVVMKEVEMRQLLDTLCWDGRLVKVMAEKGYKAVRWHRSNSNESSGNGITESPCGRCPVFDLCGDGGPVTARSCIYFNDWFGF